MQKKIIIIYSASFLSSTNLDQNNLDVLLVLLFDIHILNGFHYNQLLNDFMFPLTVNLVRY